MLTGLDDRYRIGQEIDASPAFATRLITRGYAVPVREVEVEQATVVAPEKAMKRKGRKKRNVEPS